MNTLIVLAAGVLVAYLARPGRGPRPASLADVGLGLVGGVIGLIVARHIAAGGAWELGLPLLVASALALGLQSIQQTHRL